MPPPGPLLADGRMMHAGHSLLPAGSAAIATCGAGLADLHLPSLTQLIAGSAAIRTCSDGAGQYGIGT